MIVGNKLPAAGIRQEVAGRGEGVRLFAMRGVSRLSGVDHGLRRSYPRRATASRPSQRLAFLLTATAPERQSFQTVKGDGPDSALGVNDHKL
jgi:hypothetical protein